MRRPTSLNGAVRVAVWEENEIFRRGVIASLAEDRSLHVIASAVEYLARTDVDVAIVSSEVANANHFPFPIILCTDASKGQTAPANGNSIAALLSRGTLTGAQLRATVHAAATGLVVSGASSNGSQPQLDPRSTQVIEMIAEGFSTREIATRMSYSERTIKKLIASLRSQFQARSRAQIVARAIRDGLI
jgi:DNA-binding NarL/FixJ family response regulator